MSELTTGWFVDTGDHIWAEIDRDGQVTGYHASSQRAVKELLRASSPEAAKAHERNG